MIRPENYNETIDRYLSGELAGQELRDFEEALKTNTELAQKFKLHQELYVSLRKKEMIELRKQLLEIKNTARREKSFFHALSYKYYLLAASVALLIGLAYWGIRSYNSQEMAQKDNPVTDTASTKQVSPEQQSKEVTPENKEEKKSYKKIMDARQDLEKTQLASVDFNDPRYKLSASMASLVGQNVRSGYFDLMSPKDSTVFESNKPIIFCWEADTKKPIYLELLNGKGSVVFKSDKGLRLKKICFCRDIPDKSLVAGNCVCVHKAYAL